MIKKIVVILIVAFSQFTFSQEKVLSRKKLEVLLLEAGDNFYDLKVDESLKKCKIVLHDAYILNDNNLIAKAYNIIGLNFDEFYSYDKGIEYYNKALKYAEKSGNDTIKDWVYNNLGNVYSYSKKDINKSIYYYKKALYFSKKVNDVTEVLYTNLNVCSAYFAVNNFEKGIPYLKNAEESVLKSKEIEAKMSYYSLYGTYYSSLNDNVKAENCFNNAVLLSKQNKDKLIDSNVCDIYNDFSNFYRKNKDFEKALYYLNLHKELKESVYNDDRTREVKLIGSEIELEDYQRQINKMESEKYSQSNDLKESKLIVLLFIIILFILLLFVFSLYKNNNFRDKTNFELQSANVELKLAKEKAENASKLKSQFVSTITHELRTPLYGVVGITNIIIDEHKELANSPHLNSLKFSAGYLLSLVNDLLQINKIEENRIQLEELIFNVHDEVSTIVDSLQFIAKKNNNKLVIEVDPSIPETLIGDKLRLSQVFMNLISNSLKFTKDGTVTVKAKKIKSEGSKQFIEFKIQDTGVGIAKEDQQKIFEKFVQIERKEGDYQGTGLGLAIVKKLVEIFDSKINLESEEGVGTTFSFAIAFESDDKIKNQIINNIEVDLSTNYFYRVLVVEDNKINQLVTRKILENNSFKCTIIDDGYAAIDLLESERFDVILMDINMPIINGFDTTKLIRKKGITIPIIALTAFDKQEVTEQALSSGMNDIIIKPFEPSKLFHVISNLVDKKKND